MAPRSLAAWVAMALALLPAAALAYGAPDIAEAPEVKKAWARAMPPGAPNGAVYLTVVNETDRAVTVTGARSPAAEVAQIHETVETDSGTGMRHRDKVKVPGGKTLTFEPGGWHIMLMGLNRQLTEGGTVEITVTFDDHDPWTGEAEVAGIAARAAP